MSKSCHILNRRPHFPIPLKLLEGSDDSFLMDIPTVRPRPKYFWSKTVHFDGFGDKCGFIIKFKFDNSQKTHPCLISRILSYCPQKSVTGVTCRRVSKKVTNKNLKK